MKPKHKRMIFVAVSIVVMAFAITLILKVFNDNLMYFYTPSMLDEKLKDKDFARERDFRLGGLVEEGSVRVLKNNAIQFRVTDGTSVYSIEYKGLLPTLFRAGQGVVLVGTLHENRTIIAKSILAKHDENYMPPEVADALKKSNHWGGKGSSYATPAKEHTP